MTTLHTGGVLTNSEIWVTGSVHVVYGTITVPTNVTLTIASGAVVKFVGGGIVANGAVIANGVIFTDIDDDSFGGDTRQNGTERTYPSYVLTGKVETDEETLVTCALNNDSFFVWGEIKPMVFDTRGTALDALVNATVHRGGTLSVSETWTAGSVHVVYGTITVPTNATLTIAPGAVVKFIGGGIVANGAVVAKGVTFTDIDDDSFGGDTRQNGTERTYPSYVLTGNLETDDETLIVCAQNNDSLLVCGETKASAFNSRGCDPADYSTATVHTGGTLSDSETWATGTSHIVYGTVTVPTNATLTIASGAVVKFIGGGLIAQGPLVAHGVIFTDIGDDSYGGVTSPEDGSAYPSYVVSGNIEADETSRFHCTRNVDAFHAFGELDMQSIDTFEGVTGHAGGVMEYDEIWAGTGTVHYVLSDLVIRSGTHLTIEPGAVVKVAPNCLIIVEDGASLSAVGTAANRIDFASISTNDVADATTFWRGFLFGTNAVVNVDYVRLSQCGTDYSPQLDLASFDHLEIDAGTVSLPIGNSSGVRRTLTIRQAEGASAFSGRISGAVDVVKTGAGEICLDIEQSSWVGSLDVVEGVCASTSSVLSAAGDSGTHFPTLTSRKLYDDNFLLHRWSFNSNYIDSVGGQTAMPKGNVEPTFSSDGKSVRLPGGSWGTSYIELGTNVFGNAEPVTIEIWATQHELRNWAGIFCCGADTSNYFTPLWSARKDALKAPIHAGSVNYGDEIAFCGYPCDQNLHISLVLVRNEDLATQVSLTKRDASTGVKLGSYEFVVENQWSLAELNHAMCRLGHSVDSGDDDAHASYDEVRIWRAALSDAQLEINAVAGPDIVPDIRPTLPILPPSRAITVAEGASLDLRDGFIVSTNVTGTVTNGFVVAPKQSTAPVITSTNLPSAIVRRPYEAQFAVTNGTTPYAWRILSGAKYVRTTVTNSFSDIADGPLVANTAGDNVCSAAHTLPFAFPFFGKCYTNVWLSCNGTISFDGAQTERSPTVTTFRSRPWIAGLWRDLNLSEGGIYFTHSSEERVSFRWKGAYYSGGQPIDFAVSLYKSGRVVVSYGEGNASGGWVGVASGEGYVNYVSSGDSWSRRSDVVFTPDSLPVGLSCNEAGMIAGMPIDDGTNVMRVAVTDVRGEVGVADVTLVVSPHTNAQPIVTGYAPQVRTVVALPEDETVFTVSAYDPLGDALSYVWLVDGVTNLVTDAGRFVFHPAETFGGRHRVTCLVTDGFWTIPVEKTWTTETPKWYVANTGDDANAGDSFATGFATLQKAVDTANEGDIVYVAAGSYESFETGNKNIRVWAARGVRPVVDGGGTNRCVTAGSSGQTATSFRDLVFRNGYTAENGGGALGGTFDRCVFEGCFAENGGGVSGAILTNCQLEDNSARLSGGGAQDSTLTHCTVVRNRARLGGGVSGSTVRNGIVWDNHGADRVLPDNFYGDKFSFSSTYPMPSNGSGNRTDDPLLVKTGDGLYRLFEGSPCVDAADAEYVVGDSDLVGTNRVQGAAADLGATEGAVSGLLVRAVADGAGMVAPCGVAEEGSAIQLEARPLDANHAFLGFFTNGVKIAGATEQDGIWQIAYAPTDSGSTVTAKFAAQTFYVATNGNDAADGLAWQTARRTINAAIPLARSGDTILVADGVYEPVVATDNLLVTIRSANGYAAAIIDGGGTNRCALLGLNTTDTNTVLRGFTIRNGSAQNGAGAMYGTVVSGYITENHSSGDGGGIWHSVLRNCVLWRNHADGVGGGAAYTTMFNCTIFGNDAVGATGNKSHLVNTLETTRYNDIYNEDVGFVYASEGDFRLRGGSSALDSGENSYVRDEVDISGSSRIQNECVDLGAFEGATVGHVISTAISGYGDVSPRYALVQTGESATFTAVVGDRPFLGFSTNGVDIIETGLSYTWPQISGDGTLTLHFATNIYVNAASGDDANGGFMAKKAKRTLQAAIDLARDGEVVLASEGVYAPVSTDNKSITVIALGGHEKTSIDGGGTNRCVYVIGKDWQTNRDVKFVGFTICNGCVTDANSGGAGCSGGTFDRCLFTANNCSGNNCWGGAARYATLNNCLIAGNRSYGGAGAHYSTLVNCTVTDNVASGNNGGGCYVCTVVNSIVWNNMAPNSCSNYYGGTFTYTCSAPLHSGTGNVCTNPYFTDAASGDYRLRQYSLCLDAGANASVVGDLDLAGTNRIMDASVDMGAYEGWVYLPVPGTPSNVTASLDRHVGFVRLAWTADEFARSFRVERATDEAFADVVRVAETTDAFYDDTTTLPTSNYWYRIVAVNPTGESAPSTVVAGRCLAAMEFGDLALASGQAGVSYNAKLSVSGGSGVYVWKSGADNYDAKRRSSTYLEGTAASAGLYSVDDAAVAYPLPFDFPFFGKIYNKLWISSNGTLSFDGAFSACSPDLSTFKSRVMIAPFWKDLRTGSSGVRVEVIDGESVTFFWSDCSYYSGGGAVNAAATLFADGTIAISYGEGNASGAFVGISAGDGVRYKYYGWQSQSLNNADDLVFAPQTIPAGLALSADGTISGKPKAPGNYTFSVLVTDDLGNAVTQTLTLDVSVNENLLEVQFDLGENGTRAGGGDLVQYVAAGESVDAPSVRARSGLVFDSWSGTYTNITSNTVVTANYRSAYVDLHVDAVSAPLSVCAGETLTINWTVGNTGNPSFSGTMTERVSLVSSTNAADVRVIKTVPFEGTIARDGTVERSTTIDVPLKGWDGTWYVRVETAVKPSMREAGGDNTWTVEQALTITPVPLPDLVIDEIAAPSLLIPGENATISFRETNVGAGEAKPDWTDAVYLESMGDGSSVRLGSLSRDEALASEGVASLAMTFALPEQIALAGDVRVRIVVDEDDAVVESDESNVFYGTNVLMIATNLYLLAATDSVKENVSSGVRFTVKRSGQTTEPMTVTLVADAAGQVTMPETITIPAGNSSTIFYVKPIDNTLVEGSRVVGITATSGSCRPASFDLTILDNEVPKLTITLDKNSIREGEGKIIATVTRELVTDQPLTVYLSGASTSRCSYPTSVTIPAGEASVTFFIEPINNSTAEIAANMTIRASSAGYSSGAVSYQIEDDDVPGVTLAITPEVVSEGAGAKAIYATLTRSDQNQIEKAVRVKLTASVANQLIMPSEVTIPKYTMAVRFAIGVVDNGLDDGDRDVTIDGAIVIESCGCSGQPSNGDVIQAVVGIIDNDGPSLSLTASPATMKEGLNPAGYLTLAHNSVLDEDLTVRLWIDEENEDELIVPETVTIPAGQTSVRIPVQTFDDGVEDGGQLVSIYVEDDANVFAPASTWVQVSDQNLPDLAVGAVSLTQKSYVALEQFDVTFEVKNIGFATRVGGVPYQVHIVKGANNGTTTSSTLVMSGRVEDEISTNDVVTVPISLSVPEMPADYRVAIILDANDEVSELDDANNTGWSSAFSVSPAYTATVALNGSRFMPGEVVTITGTVVMADHVTPAANAKIDVYVLMNGTRRSKTVTADAAGAFSLSFEPSSGEAGHYTVGACYPGMNSSSTMASFDIMGIKRSSSGNIIWDIALGDQLTRTVYIQNRSSIPITGVRATITGVPEECELTYTLAETIPGNGSIPLSMTAKAIDLTEQTAYKNISIHIDTDQGLTLDFPAYFHSQSQKAQLRITPTSVNTTMAIGHTRYLEFTVANDGKGESGKVTLSIPSTSWLRLVSESVIDNLSSGESAIVTLEVSPSENDNLVLNSPLSGGRLAVNCTNGSGCSASLRFTPVSESTGGVSVDVLDNSTYVLESAPHLSNATVKVTNPYTGVVVASGKTDSTGCWTNTGIPEGRYQLTITAENHDSYADELIINPGETSKVSAFIQSKVVSVSWTVEKTEIEDQYEIQQLLEFETSVPAPIVKTSMPSELPELDLGESYSFIIHVENSGMIAAEKVTLTMPTITGCTFQLSDNEFQLPAKSSKDIAAVISRPAPKMSLLGASSNSGSNSCWHRMNTDVQYPCGIEHPTYGYGTMFRYGNCSGASSSDVGTITGGGSWSWGGSTGGQGTSSQPTRGDSTAGYISTGDMTAGSGSTYQKKNCNPVRDAIIESTMEAWAKYEKAGWKFLSDNAKDLVYSLLPFSGCLSLAINGTFTLRGWATGGKSYAREKGFFKAYTNRAPGLSGLGSFTADTISCVLDVLAVGEIVKGGKVLGKLSMKVWREQNIKGSGVLVGDVLKLALDRLIPLRQFKDPDMATKVASALGEFGNITGAASSAYDHLYEAAKTINEATKTLYKDTASLFSGPNVDKNTEKMLEDATMTVAAYEAIDVVATELIDEFCYQDMTVEDGVKFVCNVVKNGTSADDFKVDPNDFIDQDTSKKVKLQSGDDAVKYSEIYPSIPVDYIISYCERWNRSIDKWVNDTGDGFVEPDEDEIDFEKISLAISCLVHVGEYIETRGFDGLDQMHSSVIERFIDISNSQDDSVCASVTLKLSQTLAMTREAFNGTLTLYNGNGTTPIRDLKMDVSILDEEGNECRDLFVMNDLGTSGEMSAGWVVDGGLSVSAGGTGSAVIQFIPSRNAAPTVEKVYRFGGTITYTDPFSGEKATVQLTPVSLTVSPSPYLKLDYFIQRDVYADDPTTDQVEASMPAEMAVLVVNTGAGDAKNVTISSVQPEIVKNEKGLDVEFSMKDYSLDATALNGATAHLGLNVVSLGTIPAGESQVAQWWLTSSIQGHFTKMSASVTPVNSWNTPDTVLVNPDVGMHKLVRSLAVEGEKLPYFLTSEQSNLYGTPDTIYDSNGGCEMVRNDAVVTVSGTLRGSTPTLTITVQALDTGWNYIHTVMPGLFGYEISSVVRSDNSVVPTRNAWITDRTFRDSKDPVLEDCLHLADDFASAGVCVYTISLKAKPTDIPAVLSFEGVSDGAVEYAVRDEVSVVFTKEIDPSTFTVDDIILQNQGVRVADLDGVTITGVEGIPTEYVIKGLSSLCNTHGRYELTVQCAGIADLSGQLGSVGKSVTWAYSISDAPYIVDAEGLPVRPVRNLDSIVAITSTAVDPESFSNATIKLNGVDVSDSLVIRSVDAGNSRYEIAGLESLQHEDGSYTLVIEGSGLRSFDGTHGINTFSRSWTRDTTAPALLSVMRGEGMDGNKIAVSFTEKIDETTLSLNNVKLNRDGQEIVLPSTVKMERKGDMSYVVSGLDATTATDGTYLLTFDSAGVADEAGNVATGSKSVTWTVDTTPPVAPTGLAVSTPYGSVADTVYTSVGTMTVSGVAPEADVTVQILYKYVGGSETLLAMPTVGEDGAFSANFTLPENGGNFSIIVRQTDAAGNSTDTVIKTYYDKVALTATLSGAPTDETVSVDTITLTFSDAVETNGVTLDKFTLTHDGESIELTGAMLTPSADDKSFALAGLAALCLSDGAYTLSFDSTNVCKRSSGMKASVCTPISWNYKCPDREPPVVTAIIIDGEDVRDTYTNGISSISVMFSESVNLQTLVSDGLVGQALRIQLLNANDSVTDVVRAATSEVTCSATNITWRLPDATSIRGRARVVVDAGIVTDLAGNTLASTGFSTVGGLQRFEFDSAAAVSVANYAMPTWYDYDGDGLGDLIVGEKTASGQGKVRVYRNVGTATQPVFDDFSYLQVNGADLAISASGCQGAQVTFADVTGDGFADLIVGHSDGRVQMHPGSATAGAYGSVVELRSGSENTYGSDRAYVCPYDLDGDGAFELVIGGLDGQFRLLKYVQGSTTETWLTDATCSPLKVSAGRSSPVLADVNSDGCVDILSGDTDGNVWVFLGEGAAWNATPVSLYTKSGSVADRSRLGFGDVNGDGIGDLLVGRTDGSVVPALGSKTESPSVAFRVRSMFDVSFDPGDHGTVCSGEQSQQIVEDDLATAPVVAAHDGWRFTGWSPDVSQPITSAMTFVAQYGRIYHNVVIRHDDGTATTNCIAWGDAITYNAPSNIVDELCKTQYVCLGTSFTAPTVTNTFTLTVTNDLSFAWDVWQTNYWFEISPMTNGTVIGCVSGWCEHGTELHLMPVPDMGSDFAFWTGDTEGCVDEDGILLVTADRARTIGAVFEIDESFVFPDGVYTQVVDGVAWSFQVSGAWTMLGDGKHAIEAFKDLDGPLSLPSHIGGHSINIINYFAFLRCAGLSSVEIPDGVQAVSGWAFNSCGSLASVTFPQGMQLLHLYSFAFCTNLTSVVLPDGIRRLYDGVFYGCSKLETVTIPSSIEQIDEDVFNGCISLRRIFVDRGDIQRVKGLLSNAAIPDDVEFVERWCAVFEHIDGTIVTNLVEYGSELTLMAPSDRVDASGKTRVIYQGTSLTAPVVTNRFTLTVTNDVAFAWDICQTNYWFARSKPMCGTLEGPVTGWYECGADFTLTATPIEHYHLAAWTGDVAGCNASGSTLSGVMDRPRTVGANFEIDKHAVQICDGLATTVPGTGSYDYAYGSMATVTVLNAVCYSGATQFVCTGWTATGAEPDVGVGTQAVFRVVGDTTINWTWQTNVLTLAEALNTAEMELTTGGAGEWMPTWTTDAPDNEHRVQISGIANKTNAWMQTVVDGPGTLSFAWKCSFASRNTKLQFFVDDAAQGAVGGLTDWTTVQATVLGNGEHIIKWRLFTGRSGASSADLAAIDGIVWTQTVPPTLAEALNTNLVWRTDGDSAWCGAGRESLLDPREAWAIASGLDNNDTAAVWTKVYGSGILTFDWAISCEEEYDWMELTVDGNICTYITGDVDWNTAAIEIEGDGWHVVRWEYIKDEEDDEDLVGDNAAWLDNVVWTSSDVAEEPDVPEEPVTDPIPDLGETPTEVQVQKAIDGSGDMHLVANVTNGVIYNAYRAWANKVELPSGGKAGARAVKDSPNAWLSFAIDSVTLIETLPQDGDMKIETFDRAATSGSYDFTVSVKGLFFGSEAIAENLKTIFELEGGTSLDPKDMSSDNVSIIFGTPVDGKLRFTAGPKDTRKASFFMKMKMNP